jgi:hypothetical protein
MDNAIREASATGAKRKWQIKIDKGVRPRTPLLDCSVDVY